MRRLLLTLTITLYGFVSFTQTISIYSEYVKTYSKYGIYVDNNKLLNSPDSIYERIFSPSVWKIDLEKQTLLVTSINEPITINDLKINKNGSVYVVDYVEKYGDEFLPVTLFIDISKNTMRCLYYWEDSSWVQQRDNLRIKFI